MWCYRIGYENCFQSVAFALPSRTMTLSATWRFSVTLFNLSRRLFAQLLAAWVTYPNLMGSTIMADCFPLGLHHVSIRRDWRSRYLAGRHPGIGVAAEALTGGNLRQDEQYIKEGQHRRQDHLERIKMMLGERTWIYEDLTAFSFLPTWIEASYGAGNAAAYDGTGARVTSLCWQFSWRK